MKKTVIIFLFAISCVNNPVKKPKNLLDENTMENVLLDYYLIQAGTINAQLETQEMNLTPLKFVTQKYKIDSATFIQNHKYYAGNVNDFKHLNKRIFDRIEKMK